MTADLGHFALCLAFVAAVLQAVIPLLGVRHRNTAMRFTDAAAQMQFLATLGAFAALSRAYVTSDFSVRTVA
ncbi:MAG: hypothetical protein ACE5EU_02215 [Paracoccaceae bacterium]